jgi:predicted PolB exonuclease-like 3'-5' exonuclease
LRNTFYHLCNTLKTAQSGALDHNSSLNSSTTQKDFQLTQTGSQLTQTYSHKIINLSDSLYRSFNDIVKDVHDADAAAANEHDAAAANEQDADAAASAFL